MRLSRSAHLDTFCRDRLPPQDQWPEFRFDLPELNYPERLNCAVELLDATAARVGASRPCLHSASGTGAAGTGTIGMGAAGTGTIGTGPSETWTYGEVVRRTNQLAQVLTEDFGLRPGNRVLLRGPNTPWLAVAWLAVIKAGGVAVTTMALLRPREIATIVGLTQPSLALCDHRFAADLAAGAPALTALHYGPALDGTDEPGDLIARCAAKDGTFTAVDTAADDVAMLASTSGTTGQPKVAMHFHRDVLATADTFSKYMIKPRPDDVFTGTPPLGFTYGLGGLLLFPLRAGASTLLIERATIRDADGYYWFQARSDDLIISAGYNIAGPEVEEALLGHPDVLEAAVIGAPDPGRGMVVQAFVVLREGAVPDAAKVAELQEFARQSIAPYKYPRTVEFVAELPKTVSGKTQRYRLRQMAEARLQARSG